ncbi:MAG TPA: hypothetical protein VFN66_02195 [Burkholderiales bacterium]|nr:hypothetical protein [Burkholderiales bacterium]
MNLSDTIMAGTLVQGARQHTQVAHREINRLKGEINKGDENHPDLIIRQKVT